MSWENELISSQEEGVDFIDRHLLALGIHKDEYVKLSKRSENSAYTILTEYGRPSQHDILVMFDIGPETATNYLVNDFWINKDLRGHDLSKIMLKSILGAAYEAGARTIRLHDLTYDGTSFWPSFGALPMSAPTDLAIKIRDEMALQAELSAADLKTLRDIVQIAEENSYLGWHKLSTSPVSASFKEKFWRKMCWKKDLRILLDLHSTQSILENRLGVLPPFRASTGNIGMNSAPVISAHHTL